MWINDQTQTVYRLHSEIRTGFPDVSMPAVLTDAVIESLGILPVILTAKPDGYVVEELPPALIDGVWTQQWQIRPPTESETQAKADEVRAERNRRLSDCDWTQVADAPVDKVQWATYRQALRDITALTGFPWEITWPTPPESL